MIMDATRDERAEFLVRAGRASLGELDAKVGHTVTQQGDAQKQQKLRKRLALQYPNLVRPLQGE